MKKLKEECVCTLRKSLRFTASFHRDLWSNEKAGSHHKTGMSDMIWSRVTGLERQQSAACEKLRLSACLDSVVCRWAWQGVDERSLQCVCVRACVEGEKKKRERMLERESVCQIADVAVCECVKARREFMRWHLVSCLTFPVSQGSSFKNNAEEKPPTTDNWNATRKRRRRKKKNPGAVCWWLNYCHCLRLETGEMCEWLHSACCRHVSPTGLLYPSISQRCAQWQEYIKKEWVRREGDAR